MGWQAFECPVDRYHPEYSETHKNWSCFEKWATFFNPVLGQIINFMEKKYYDIAQLRAQVSITQFLTDLGFTPAKRSAGETFYHSMIREGDFTPSFCVNEKMGLWFDHGLGKGGNLFDLAMAMWPELSFQEVLHKIAGRLADVSILSGSLKPLPAEVSPVKDSWHKITSITELGGNKSLMEYLDFRGIKDIAKDYLKEVRYEVTLKEGKQKTFCAAGWPNEKGGWEIRSASFKGCLGKKGISLIEGASSKLSLFKGFMDFLSWRKTNPSYADTVIVLNSVVNLKEVLPIAAHYAAVDVFFDNDVSGKKASAELISAVPYARDQATAYLDYKDYNEKYMSEHPRPWKERSEILTSQLYKPISGKR